MRLNVSKWGNSLAVRIPRSIASDVHIFEGTPVDLHVDGGSLVITPSRPKYELSDLLGEMKTGHKHMEADWGGPEGEEAW